MYVCLPNCLSVLLLLLLLLLLVCAHDIVPSNDFQSDLCVWSKDEPNVVCEAFSCVCEVLAELRHHCTTVL